MPREQINYPDSVAVDTDVVIEVRDDDHAEPTVIRVPQHPVVSVHWSPEAGGGHVQISVQANAYWLTMLANEATANGEPTASIYTSALTRDEINRLIRTLRRARDRVYGKDA